MRSERFLTASSTFVVPTTLTAAPSGGFARQNGTCSAARWMTFVTLVLVEGPLEVGEVGDVTLDARHPRRVVWRHGQSEAVVVIAEIERHDGNLSLDQLAHDPCADAAIGPGDQDAGLGGRRCHGGHGTGAPVGSAYRAARNADG